jgi:hypothetical protein
LVVEPLFKVPLVPGKLAASGASVAPVVSLTQDVPAVPEDVEVVPDVPPVPDEPPIADGSVP